jgi:uncharacterized damage-inducible protein DinB
MTQSAVRLMKTAGLLQAGKRRCGVEQMNELDRFFATWDYETQGTLKLLRALPKDKYDFRPDAQGRTLGELAWHLAEGDAYITQGIDTGVFFGSEKPAHIDRPKTVDGLASGFEVVHGDALARMKKLTVADLDRKVNFFTTPMPIRDVMWSYVIHHGIHHRGQLSLMCRLAGGQPPGLYGPNREEMAAMMAGNKF